MTFGLEKNARRGNATSGHGVWLIVAAAWMACAPAVKGGGGASGTGGAGQAGQAGQAGGSGPAASGGAGVAIGDAAVPNTDGGNSEAPGAVPDAAIDRLVVADAVGTDLPGWTLVWSDEFDQDGPPNVANWRYETGFVRNMELQWYQPANASVANGVLTIEGRRERVPNPNFLAGSTDWKRSRQFAEYTSSSMTTAGKHTFTYGRFEARARIDVRQGSWPAFWEVGTTGGWPAGGEVDIMEFYASTVLANVCLPMGATCGWSSIRQTVAKLGGATWASQFHVWAMQWDAQTIDLFLDDVLVNHFNVADAVPAGTMNPYVNRPIYLLVNLALGANGGDPTNTTFPMKYEVDYVRAYQRAP